MLSQRRECQTQGWWESKRTEGVGWGESRSGVKHGGWGGKQDTNIKYQLKFLFLGPNRILSFLSLGSSWLICPLSLIRFHPVHSFFFFSHSIFSTYILLSWYHRGLCTTEKQTAVIFPCCICLHRAGWLDINWMGWESMLTVPFRPYGCV